MPDLLLELRSEEIPARMQRKAAGDLKKLVTDALVEAGLTYEAAREYWTPRRLTLDVRGLSPRSADIREERKGPRTDAGDKAIEGFLRASGLASIAEADVQSDPKKGEFYVAVMEKPGRAAHEIVAGVMPGIIRDFPWPKSMRSGAASARPGALRWVRSLQSIVCTLGTDHDETVVVPFEIDGISASNVTYGHRFHAPEAITVKRFDDYATKLERAKVVLDAERRKHIIANDAANFAFASGLELVEDEALLEEVAGLVEWPQVLLGTFEEDYLAIPAEIIRLTIKTNQKCFVCRPHHHSSDSASGSKEDGQGSDASLSNHFLLVANIEAKDGGGEIRHGNGKVVRARLSDAAHFWKRDQDDLPDLEDLQDSAAKFDLDLKKPLDQRMAKLDVLNVTFHAKLGTQGDRVTRIRALAAQLARVTGADPQKVDRAVVLAKADLRTEAVGEFPELQGLMGRKYAALQGEDASVATAIEDHYKPQGPSDRVPDDRVALTVALTDKLDILTGFWAIDEKPTGSKDPYALRRVALGVVRILLERGIKMKLLSPLMEHANFLTEQQIFSGRAYQSLDVIAGKALSYVNYVSISKLQEFDIDWHRVAIDSGYLVIGDAETVFLENDSDKYALPWVKPLQDYVSNLLSFFHDRLKVYLRDLGARYDLIDAVLAADAQAAANDDLLMIARRVEALTAFITASDGVNLLAGTKRATQLLASEEKKGTRIAERVSEDLLMLEAEKALYAAVVRASAEASSAIAGEDFRFAIEALSKLRAPVDRFFDNVLVNDENADIRANRLALLKMIREATGTVADFSKIAG